jgi:hypothetical protein
MQAIRPATYLLFIPSQCLYVTEGWLWLLGLSGVQLACSLQVLRVFSLEPPRVGGPLYEWWCESVGVLCQPTAVGGPLYEWWCESVGVLCQPTAVGGPLYQWWCKFVGVLCQLTAVGDAVGLHSVFDGRDS